MTDWEKYAAREYDDLIADEEYNKGYDYEDDFEEEEEEDKMILGNLAKSAVETYTKQRKREREREREKGRGREREKEREIEREKERGQRGGDEGQDL